jgi:hypothetical protein
MLRIRNIIGVLLIGVAVLACSTTNSLRHQVAMISVTGAITNKVIFCQGPIAIVLTVKNVTHRDLHVPKHFNSNNCSFWTTNNTFYNFHGDDRLATFDDFVRLSPGQTIQIHSVFPARLSGEGVFSVSFYNNLTDEVRRQLEQTGVPFIIEVSHDFKRVKVEASNKPAAPNAGIGSRLTIGHHWPGVGEPGR